MPRHHLAQHVLALLSELEQAERRLKWNEQDAQREWEREHERAEQAERELAGERLISDSRRVRAEQAERENERLREALREYAAKPGGLVRLIEARDEALTREGQARRYLHAAEERVDALVKAAHDAETWIENYPLNHHPEYDDAWRDVHRDLVAALTAYEQAAAEPL